MEDRSQKSRSEFASLVAARTKGRNPAIERAFASVRREAFAGPGPWSIAKLDAAGYVRTPNDDPAHLYQDVVIALDPVRNLNIGLPSGHAIWLDAIDVKAGDHVVQVGAGTDITPRSWRISSAAQDGLTRSRSSVISLPVPATISRICRT